MTYLRVVCYCCGRVWNYYDEKQENYPQTTAVPVLGGTCPKCSCPGYIGRVRDSANNLHPSQNKGGGTGIQILKNGVRLDCPGR